MNESSEKISFVVEDFQYGEVKKKVEKLNQLYSELTHLEQLITSENEGLNSLVFVLTKVNNFTKIDLKEDNRIDLE